LSVLCLVGSADTASAQATRTWVSGVGDDANPCSRTAPCKTFVGAISKTAAGGEIDALDPAGFGVLTITKSITIDGNGMLASALAAGTTGFVINAGAADVITIRNLSINGVGTGLNGLVFNSGAALHLENVSIFGFTMQGISFAPAAAAILMMKNVSVTNNGAGILIGMLGQAVMSKSLVFACNTGLHTQNTARATVHDTTIVGNATVGVFAEGTSQISMDHGIIANNGVGVQADSTVRLSEVMVGHNTTGLAGVGVASFGNNRIAAGNGTNGAPTTTLLQQRAASSRPSSRWPLSSGSPASRRRKPHAPGSRASVMTRTRARVPRRASRLPVRSRRPPRVARSTRSIPPTSASSPSPSRSRSTAVASGASEVLPPMHSPSTRLRPTS